MANKVAINIYISSLSKKNLFFIANEQIVQIFAFNKALSMFSTIECELSTNNICTYLNYILLFTTGMFAFDCFNICAEGGTTAD